MDYIVGAFVLSALAALGALLAMLDRLFGLPVFGLAVFMAGVWLLLPTFFAGLPLDGEAVVGSGIALLWSCVLPGYVGYGALRWWRARQ